MKQLTKKLSFIFFTSLLLVTGCNNTSSQPMDSAEGEKRTYKPEIICSSEHVLFFTDTSAPCKVFYSYEEAMGLCSSLEEKQKGDTIYQDSIAYFKGLDKEDFNDNCLIVGAEMRIASDDYLYKFDNVMLINKKLTVNLTYTNAPYSYPPTSENSTPYAFVSVFVNKNIAFLNAYLSITNKIYK